MGWKDVGGTRNRAQSIVFADYRTRARFSWRDNRTLICCCHFLWYVHVIFLIYPRELRSWPNWLIVWRGGGAKWSDLQSKLNKTFASRTALSSLPISFAVRNHSRVLTAILGAQTSPFTHYFAFSDCQDVRKINKLHCCAILRVWWGHEITVVSFLFRALSIHLSLSKTALFLHHVAEGKKKGEEGEGGTTSLFARSWSLDWARKHAKGRDDLSSRRRTLWQFGRQCTVYSAHWYACWAPKKKEKWRERNENLSLHLTTYTPWPDKSIFPSLKGFIFTNPYTVQTFKSNTVTDYFDYIKFYKTWQGNISLIKNRNTYLLIHSYRSQINSSSPDKKVSRFS